MDLNHVNSKGYLHNFPLSLYYQDITYFNISTDFWNSIPAKNHRFRVRNSLKLELGEGNGTPLQYSCLENPWMEEPGRLQSTGSLGVGHDWATSLSLFTFLHWRRKWQPTPLFLPGESQGQGSLVGCHLWGRIESGHDWSDLAAKLEL